MSPTMSLLVGVLVFMAATASAATVEYTLKVGDSTFNRMCGNQIKTVVNGSLPGPVIEAREGDTLVIHVLNNSPHNITIHWHGVFQLYTAWADGPAYVTQCPMVPKTSFTYRFNVTGQEGTLWWHVHIGMIRETAHGAFIIRPRRGRSYPFPKPDKEVPIILGEWWNANIFDVEDEFITNGGSPRLSDALTINGQPGALYPCSANGTYQLNVVQGKTYLLRMVNAVMHDHMFFGIAQHNFTVVAVDGSYTVPYKTDVIAIAPGQSADVLITANQPLGNYYMASHTYSPFPVIPSPNGTTTAILHYQGANSTMPLMPVLPSFQDTATLHTFFSNLTGLTTSPHWKPVPKKVDENMFMTVGLGLQPCGRGPNVTCATPPFVSSYRFAASLNNVSFLVPTEMSLLEAYRNGNKGVYTEDFPNTPPLEFNYTNTNFAFNLSLAVTGKQETRLKRLKYNSVVQIVLQNTAFVSLESHPIHFHGFSFYVLAQGFGNYDSVNDPSRFNLVNPQERNTIAVPMGGWAVIRFQAINPGVWFVHCHRDTHMPWGLMMAFIIENGPTPSTSLPPPPQDLPRC